MGTNKLWQRICTMAAGLLIAGFFAGPASAELYVQVSCSELTAGPLIYCNGTGGSIAANPGQVYAADLSGGFPGANSFAAHAAAKADYGALGVSAHTTATNVTPQEGQPPYTYTNQLLAQTTSRWDDTVHFDVPAGTLVDVKVDVSIDIAAASLTASPLMRSTGYLSYTIAGQSYCWNEDSFYPQGSGICGGATALLHAGHNAFSFVASMSSGSPLGGLLYAEAQQLPYGLGTGSTDIEALSTAHTYLTVLTPGVTLTSSSGHDYSAMPVPEPATYLMLAVGLAVLGWGARRGSLRAA